MLRPVMVITGRTYRLEAGKESSPDVSDIEVLMARVAMRAAGTPAPAYS
jgi:hypothetical protein